MRRIGSWLAVVTLLAAGCGGGADAPPGRLVRFTTEDGVRLTGEARGRGAAGVVLAHMYPSERTSWGEFAAELAGRGYLTLALDFRGYGDSDGAKDIAEIWRDVLAAVSAIREEGADRVVVAGASMGGTAALIAASRAEVHGVITLSAPESFMGLSASPGIVAAIDEPKLFLAAEGDGSAAETAQALYDRASGAKRVEIVTGDGHGTELLDEGQAEVVRRLIIQFLAAHT